MPVPRPILTAELLSIGSELTVGETRDTNAGELARSLTGIGVAVGRIQALPDDFDTVRDAFAGAVGRADLVVSTGGLGPTPDDLTREAIAAAVDEVPVVDRELETWLRALWSRRGVPFPEMNVKQAWLLPSATALPNPNGTAPGWWVDRADGGVIVALPGPPREMRPMWADHALPRLVARGAGAPVASRTLRLAGIGESQVADLLGEALLRASDPVVATYARQDAVDVRISSRDVKPDTGAASAAAGAVGGSARAGGAAERVATMTDRIAAILAGHVWGEGETTWADAIGAALAGRGQSLAVVEVGTAAALTVLLGDQPWVRFAEAIAADSPTAREHGTADGLESLARRAMELGPAELGVGVRARARGADTAVSIVVVGPDWVQRERRMAFLGGANGRTRSALAAAHVLLTAIRAH
ncbi:MAG: competence/damage-inducible protein A [Chloroflexi bacterium]|nr:competence/damage-inducible protein A [Chloroflexota bacterium]